MVRSLGVQAMAEEYPVGVDENGTMLLGGRCDVFVEDCQIIENGLVSNTERPTRFQ